MLDNFLTKESNIKMAINAWITLFLFRMTHFTGPLISYNPPTLHTFCDTLQMVGPYAGRHPHYTYRGCRCDEGLIKDTDPPHNHLLYIAKYWELGRAGKDFGVWRKSLLVEGLSQNGDAAKTIKHRRREQVR